MDATNPRSMAVFVAVFLLSSLSLAAAAGEKQSYVVYLGEHAHSAAVAGAGAGADVELLAKQAKDSHYELLAGVLGDKEKAKDAIFYSYTRHINGFAANLDAAAAADIARQPGVVSVFRNRGYKLHTTRSWQFLGLAGGDGAATAAWKKARFGEDTIIGNLDTGVWPESQSFRDDGLGPVPSQWKGECQKGQDDTFSCNRKLIGARFFNKGYASAVGKLNTSLFDTPRDMDGHGTHTLSTAGGSPVPGAAVFGYGNGTASGGSPRARVAAYRVCYTPVNGSECFDADILAAFDAAIHDGVQVLSVSLGGDAGDYFADGLAIGSFHAVRRGVTVVCSAGNSGPAAGTVSNVAPWILTTAASTMDREFPSYVGQSLSASSLSPAKSSYPMIDSSQATVPNRTLNESRLCFLGALDPAKVKGKIVVCLRGINPRVEKGEAVKQAGGVGMMLANDVTTGNEIIADAHVLPATHVKFSDGQLLFSYLNKTKRAEGTITRPETRLGAKPAPFMAAFSSKGPNKITPSILKPDITGPGVSVVAAWTRATSPTDLAFDHRRVAFNSESGTSMSCPHVAGVAALLKTLRPSWSPAAIRSAIMTTASVLDAAGDRPILDSSFSAADPFGFGAGHVSPARAMSPGLVYDIAAGDYLGFLCSLRYNATVMAMFNSGEPYECPADPPAAHDLNYPSITVVGLAAAGGDAAAAAVRRTVRNVGKGGVTYRAYVTAPAGVRVVVSPDTLAFGRKGEERSFHVSFHVVDARLAKDYSFGTLLWTDGKHFVRSPLVVKTVVA
uniref:Subtilisin-like protease n=1 Tax=Leersia perrieri TaxID=77586 RepID=A0A0D9VDE2_9ORYZ